MDSFDWASCDYYLEHGKMMPDDWFESLQEYDAISLVLWAGLKSA
jgi:tartrate dehydrogenase/decarboxylase/D-malate dehydrogenase